MPIGIYPPTLQSAQPAFLYNSSSCPIYFTLQNITSLSQIKEGHIQIRVTKQANNKSIVDTSKYPDGIIYKAASYILTEDFKYKINIELSDLEEYWKPGCLYKVQLRFGFKPVFTDIRNFANWKKEQIDASAFSEWSTVMIIKAIQQPAVTIKNAKAVRLSMVNSERTETTLTPLFAGSCEIGAESKEKVDKFRFNLYSGKETNNRTLIESSGWLQHNGLVDSLDEFRFKKVLKNDNFYTVTYEIITINGYEATAEPYYFLATRNYYTRLKGVELGIESQSDYCKENACLRIKLKTDTALIGCYVLTRTDERSNFSVWEDLKYFLFRSQIFDNDVVYEDFTIESGIRYKYAFQQENIAGLRSEQVLLDGVYSVDFQHSYLYCADRQLKIKFNPKLNSFKHTVLASKQDTIGDKYPHLSRNGYANYSEFPISGLISFQMDEGQTFLSFRAQDLENEVKAGYYYDDNNMIDRDKFELLPLDRGNQTNAQYPWVNCNLTDNNIFVERKFREYAEKFLNNFSYKLYRSATEGNIVVGLMNVSLTPKTELGRMLYDFSATAYEVADNSLESLDRNNIINIGGFSTLPPDYITTSFGQIQGIYKTGNFKHNDNVYSIIKSKEEINIGGYVKRLQRITSFWIDRYSMINYASILRELEAKRVELLNDGELTNEVDAEIQEVNNIITLLNGPQLTLTKLKINGRSIIVAPNKIYSLEEPVYSLSVDYASIPIILNYVCELTDEEDLTQGVVTAVDATRIWGQVSGVFTGTDKVLKTYNFLYGPGKLPLRVYNGFPDKTIIYDRLGKVLVDNTNFNVYKTVNLLDVIKEDTKHQVELAYDVEGGFYKDNHDRWTNGSIYYEFSDIVMLDIEATPGTVLCISKMEDGSRLQKIKIGPTGRYVVNPADDYIKYLAFEKPSFAIVNYRCLTNQMILAFRGEDNVRSSQ